MKKTKTRNKSSKEKKFKLTPWHYLILVGIVLVLYFFLQGNYGVIKYFQLKNQKKTLIQQIDQLQKEEERLKKEIDKLMDDYSYIEKIVREKYKMGKTNEKIYFIISNEDEEGEN